MHREISPTERLGYSEPPLSLYLLTTLLGILLALDVWPMLVGWLGESGAWLPTWPHEWLGYRFALIAAVLGGARIFVNSLESLYEGRLGADLALTLACIASILIGEPLVAAEVVFIGMLGEVLESFTFERTQRAIRSLIEITPRRCWLLRDGQEVRILVSELKVGDQVVVKPGGRIPADGVVLDGRSTLDTSALTGESLPLEKGPGDEVLAGSHNQLGALTIEARRVAEQTVLGQVLQLTVKALQQKSQVERNADRLARLFLPTVLALAAFTFLAGLLLYVGPWGKTSEGVRLSLGEAARLATYPALSVLVVACPCALILATPAAILAALGRLAGTGVLIKGGASLERLAEVDTLAFDKTGTLTEGRLELGEILPLGGTTADELLLAAAIAEQRSEHLIARLILAEAQRRQLSLPAVLEFQAHPGGGVTARTEQGHYLVGTPRFLHEQGVAITSDILALLQQLDAGGQTAILVAREGQMLGALGARDRVRPEAADVLTELRNLGIHHLLMLTGDRTSSARVVGERVGISEIHAELLPEQKAEILARLSAGSSSVHLPAPPADAITATLTQPGTPRKVAMIGDGINDAPALAQAHVGLAIGGTGTEVAAEAGDIVFMGDPLRSLPLLIRLSRETVRIIRQNILWFAFAVNLLGVVLTAWLWPLLAPAGWWYEQSPLAAVLYHQVGSLLVLLNSMRLLWFERPSPRGVSEWQRRFLAVHRWMERNLNLDEWLHDLSHHLGRALLVIAGVGLVAYGLSGWTQINSDEVGVVRRFGRLLTTELPPGLSWRWPWPIETVTKVQPQRLRTVEIGFRTVAAPGSQPDDVRTWDSPHSGELRRYPDESLMVTGDGNLVELLLTLHYTITEVEVYLFEVGDPEEALRLIAEAVLREAVASRGFTPLLTSQRADFQTTLLARLQARCASAGERGLGLRVESLALQELHPPPEVVAAYHEVTRAMEKEKQLINMARADETQRREQAEADRLRLERDAQAERYRVLRRAQATVAVFLARWQARTQLTWSQETRLMAQALAEWRPGQPAEASQRRYAGLRQAEIARQADWSGQRLQREILAKTLPDREMVLIDAPPAVASLLYVLDQLRELAPLFAAPERGTNDRPPPPPPAVVR